MKKNELENPVHIELNNMIIKPDTGDSPYYYLYYDMWNSRLDTKGRTVSKSSVDCGNWFA